MLSQEIATSPLCLWYVHTCMCMFAYDGRAHVCMCLGGQRSTFDIIPQEPSTQIQGLSLARAHDWARLAGHQDPGICLSSLPGITISHHTPRVLWFCVGSEDQTQIFLITRQTFYKPSHVSNPHPFSLQPPICQMKDVKRL